MAILILESLLCFLTWPGEGTLAFANSEAFGDSFAHASAFFALVLDALAGEAIHNLSCQLVNHRHYFRVWVGDPRLVN